jgi:hypothetical protein
MEKKYELIEDKYGWFRVKSLKDFTLITGEHVKKGDIGGFVASEDCLSQEGSCWIKDKSEVWGQISGNAVVKDYARVCGIASENAIIKNNGFVGPHATATGNAIVQADQNINFGSVTTDLLGTKDWKGALFAEFGIVPKNGKVTLYKAVWSTDNPKVFESLYEPSFIYAIGKEVIETDVDEDVMKVCGKGLHFASLEFIDCCEDNTILECEVDLEDILTVQNFTVRARKCRVIRSL